jgi:hypothetical protein
MNTFQFFILLFFIGLIIYALHKQNQTASNNQAEEMKRRDIAYFKDSNRRMLKEMGEEIFIKYIGQDQLDKIKNGTDTEVMRMKTL